MGMLVLDLGGVPCCESHERMEGRAWDREGSRGDREAGGDWARRRPLGRDKIGACGVGAAARAGRTMALFV